MHRKFRAELEFFVMPQTLIEIGDKKHRGVVFFIRFHAKTANSQQLSIVSISLLRDSAIEPLVYDMGSRY